MISATTVVVAIVGSAIGGVVGSWRQIRHQRREAFRDRMLEAADDAVRALGSALTATRLALAELEDSAQPRTDERAAGAAREARRALDEAGDAAGRVDLLYGLHSGIGDALRTARGSLRRALSEAAAAAPEGERAFAAFREAEAAYEQFVEGARFAATDYGRWGVRRRLHGHPPRDPRPSA